MRNNQVTSFVRRNRTFCRSFVIIPALVLPFLLVYSLSKQNSCRDGVYLHAVYQNSYGLTKGNQVTMSGMHIGHVGEISLVKEGIVIVTMKVGKQYQPLIQRYQGSAQTEKLYSRGLV